MMSTGLVQLFLLSTLGLGLPSATSITLSNPVLMFISAPANQLVPFGSWMLFGASGFLFAGTSTVGPSSGTAQVVVALPVAKASAAPVTHPAATPPPVPIPVRRNLQALPAPSAAPVLHSP